MLVFSSLGQLGSGPWSVFRCRVLELIALEQKQSSEADVTKQCCMLTAVLGAFYPTI